ncbi:HopJ type III effector protein [Hydrogenovibrio marinus]|uniref:Type III effector n=1 Tax=Hydrogenovibrio marinus TaxID=28885 RepID=A0A067A1M5_HYDMR|nr:HopJ type III effector protein [Hydrogenovibrio marinus]KDN96230.1 type III effector [Hydrogenovibrio marinus]BBN60589.1 type III effector [Hydrogenovibrio marinus]
MTPQQLIEKLNQNPVDFNKVMQVIDTNYDFTPTRFVNGEQVNEENTNNGSCKLLAFGQMNQLSQQATLNAFGKFYTEEVLQDPVGDSHGNIRNFMTTGWQGVQFDSFPLVQK